MKNIIKFFGLLGLIGFSFFYTDKVINIMVEQDPIMVKINQKKDDYKILPINATINNDTIIPGLYGKRVLEKESYNNMKNVGLYLDNYFIYEDIIPDISLKNNYDKYIISGNKSIKKISILFIIYDISQLRKIEKYFQDTNIKLTYFIDEEILNNNSNDIKKLSNREIYNYGSNGRYIEDKMIFYNNLITRIKKNDAIYCLVKDKNIDVLDLCAKNKLFTILPNLIIKNNLYKETREKLENGSIILIDLKNVNISSLNNTISYINSKGLNIVYLKKLLEENTE